MLNLRRSLGFAAALGAGVLLCAAGSAKAQAYNVAYTAGGSWNTVYVQGFNTSLGATPAPSASNGATVDLSQFQFFKSGTADSASNIQLAILNSMFPGSPTVNALTTNSTSEIVGLSSNTIASTASITTGSPITFTFNNLPLLYGSDYAAVFVNVSTVPNGDGSFNVTPVLVSALTANYSLQSDSNYHPEPNYGTETQFQYATSNSISGGYFSDFTYAGDADFNASLSTVPEPASLGIFGLAAIGFLRRRPRHVTK